MSNLYARSVFFVENAERAVRFYVDRLGFAEDWNYEGVCQVSLLGFELILNEVDDATQNRAGHGRAFIGLEHEQIEPVHRHIAEHSIQTTRIDWGRSTLVITDPDGNELFLWDRPEKGAANP